MRIEYDTCYELPDSGDRGERAAGGVAADGEPRRVDTVVGGACAQNFDGRACIVERGGKWMLRSEAIVEGEYTAGPKVGERLRNGGVRVEVTRDEPSAMQIEHAGQ